MGDSRLPLQAALIYAVSQIPEAMLSAAETNPTLMHLINEQTIRLALTLADPKEVAEFMGAFDSDSLISFLATRHGG